VFTTALSPPVNKPAEYSVPVVPSFVATVVRKQPLIVPELVIEYVSAADRAFEPDEADDHAAVGRAPCD